MPTPVQNFPQADGPITTMVYYKGILYVGGIFSNIGGQARFCMAAIDPLTNKVLPFNPFPSFYAVNTMLIYNDTIYIGTSAAMNFGSDARNCGVALDLQGNVLPWDPDTDSGIFAMDIDPNAGLIYAGGSFENVNQGGTPLARPKLAAFDMITGVANFWQPGANDQVNDLIFYNGIIYFVGNFTSVNGSTPRNFAAAADNSGFVYSWDPNLNAPARSLAQYNGDIYIGFFGNHVNGGPSRQGVAGFDSVNGTVNSFDANLAGVAFKISINNGLLYIGGSFASAGGQPRLNFAIIDLATGLATSSEVNVDAPVLCMSFLPTGYILGGYFVINCGTVRRGGLAKFNSSDILLPWAPTTDGQVTDLAVLNNVVYVVGSFSNVTGPNGTFARQDFAAFDSAGNVLPWSVTANSSVFCITAYNGLLYVGGIFTLINGAARTRLAVLDENANVMSFAPTLDGYVYRIRNFGSYLYICGTFNTAEGLARHKICRFDSLGVLDTWDPDLDATPGKSVSGMYSDGIYVYIAGNFASANSGSLVTTSFCRVDINNATADPAWIPITDQQGLDVFSDGAGNIFICGDFNLVNGQPMVALAKVNDSAVLDTSFSPEPNSNDIQTLLYRNGQIYFSGSFGRLNTSTLFTLSGSAAAAGFSGIPMPNWSSKLILGSILRGMKSDSSNNLYFGGTFLFGDPSDRLHLLAILDPSPSTPRPPVIQFLNRQTMPDGTTRTLLKWNPVVTDINNNEISVSGYKIYRTASLNLEDPELIATITSVDIRGFIDTMFTEEIEGFFKYCVTAFNDTAESGKSCAVSVGMSQSERL